MKTDLTEYLNGAWQQLELFPPEAVYIRFDVYVVATAQPVGLTWAVRAGSEGTLIALESSAHVREGSSCPALLQRVQAVFEDALNRCGPF